MVIYLTVFNGRTAKLGHVSKFQKHYLLRNQTVDDTLVLNSCTCVTWIGKGYCLPSASLGCVHLYDFSRYIDSNLIQTSLLWLVAYLAIYIPSRPWLFQSLNLTKGT